MVRLGLFQESSDHALVHAPVQTMAMTGCGSVLWMAPEILLGEKYNEKIDVFSCVLCLLPFAFCLSLSAFRFS